MTTNRNTQQAIGGTILDPRIMFVPAGVVNAYCMLRDMGANVQLLKIAYTGPMHGPKTAKYAGYSVKEEKDTMQTVEIYPWRFVWRGGRLADVFHAESDTAQDCVQVAEYDWSKGELVGDVDLEKVAREWIAESGADFAANLS